jgi:ankyrin repeat protein
MIAANKGSEEIVHLLLRFGADPNFEELDSFTALLFAAHQGHVAIARMLLERGANVYHRSNTGLNALKLASSHAEMQRELVAWIDGLETYSVGGPFLDLVSLGDLNAVEDMIRRRGRFIITGEVNAQGWNSVIVAASRGDDVLLKYLLEKGLANPNWRENDGWTALLFAVSSKSANCVQLLLDYGAEIGDKDDFERAVELAEEHGEIISLLAGAALTQHLNKKREVTPGGGFSMDAGAIMHYVYAGANPNTANSAGVTALMLLAQTGEIEATRDIIRDGANVNWQEADGWTPLMFAVHGGHEHIFQLLLDQPDIDLSLQNKHGETALDIARALGGREKMVWAMNEKGVDDKRVSSSDSAEKKEKRGGIFGFFGI